jgi:hypothetical protein
MFSELLALGEFDAAFVRWRGIPHHGMHFNASENAVVLLQQEHKT